LREGKGEDEAERRREERGRSSLFSTPKKPFF
jgi:hypothetical protein